MVSRAIWKNTHIALVLRGRAILIIFEKLTRACFFPNCTRNRIITNTNTNTVCLGALMFIFVCIF